MGFLDDLLGISNDAGDKGKGGSSGGTFNSTAFSDREKRDGSGKRDVLFNGPGDSDRRGHATVTPSPDGKGSDKYHYVRDVEGNVYIDDNPNAKY